MTVTPPTLTESTIRELSALLDHLREREVSLKSELMVLIDQMNTIEATFNVVHDLTNVNTTVAHTSSISTEPPSEAISTAGSGGPTAVGTGWEQKLHGLKQIDALRCMANENGGTIRATDAKHIFLRLGLAKGDPKHVGPHIYHLLHNSSDFERTAPGTFQYLPSARLHGQ